MPPAASLTWVHQFSPVAAIGTTTLRSTASLPAIPIAPSTSSASASLSIPSTTGVMINPNSPPVPMKIVQRAWNGEYIDMAELLPQSLSAAMRGTESKELKKSLPKVQSITAWMEAFTVYAGLICTKHSDQACDLLTYMHLITHAARQHQDTPWLAYDATFRQQAAINKHWKWANIQTSLWTMAFAHASPLPSCSHCLSVDHLSSQCPEKSTTEAKPSTSRQGINPTCLKFNKG